MSRQPQLIFGLHAVSAVLEKWPERVVELYLQSARQDKKIQGIEELASQCGIAIRKVSANELDKLTQEANHQGVLAFVKAVPAYEEADLMHLLETLTEHPLLLILDGVQDPHNLGACFRSADAAGVHAIIAPKDKSVGLTGVVSKVACGAAEAVPFVQVTNLVRTMEKLKEKGIWIYGAAGEAECSLYQTNLTGPAAIVLGAEGSGLRRLTREHCDALLNIPMAGTVSSLNVSVATGVFLFEVVRQRLQKS